MTVTPNRAADFEHLRHTLPSAHRNRILDLRVSVHADGVELDGLATSYYAIQLVIRDVLAAGARIRTNHIRVRPATRN
jgi:hypothetical protein